MAVGIYTVQRKNRFSLRGMRGTKQVIFARSLTNADCVQIFQIVYKTIFLLPDGGETQYSGLARIWPVLIGGAMFSLNSNGAFHGTSNMTLMKRLNDPTDLDASTVSEVQFETDGIPGYDTSLLDGYMADGQNILIARTHINLTGATFTVTELGQVTGDGRVYSPWSPPKLANDGFYYRTGFQGDTADSRTGWLQSDANLLTWTWISNVAADSVTPLRFGECDWVQLADNSLVAMIREDAPLDESDKRNIYFARSDDIGATWTTAIQFPVDLMSGTQPFGAALGDGSYIWAFGDRTGPSGSSAGGYPRQYSNSTGVKVYRMTPAAITAGSWTAASGSTAAFASVTTSVPHNINPGNVFTIYGCGNSNYDRTVAQGIALEGTANTTLRYAMASNPGAFTTAGKFLGWGWEMQLATFVSTDGGQLQLIVVSPTKVVGVFYGVRRFDEFPRIQYVSFNPTYL